MSALDAMAAPFPPSLDSNWKQISASNSLYLFRHRPNFTSGTILFSRGRSGSVGQRSEATDDGPSITNGVGKAPQTCRPQYWALHF